MLKKKPKHQESKKLTFIHIFFEKKTPKDSSTLYTPLVYSLSS